MKIKWLFGLGFCLLLFQPLIAAPLINSPFARENPGVIPYSSCWLEGHMVGAVDTGFMGVTDGVELAFIRCESKKHRLVAKIPVKISYSLRIGLGVGFREGALFLKVANLHGKSIRQLYSKYKGWSGGLGNLGLQRHKNARKISIGGFSGGSGMSVSLPSYGGFTLIAPEPEYLARFRDDPDVLFSKTVYEHTETTYLLQHSEPRKTSRHKRRGTKARPAEPGDVINIVNLVVAQGPPVLFSIDGRSSLVKSKEMTRRNFVSPKGEIIHLLDNERIRLERANGSWAYQNLQGTFDFRDPDEEVPDFDQLFLLRFMKDGAENVDDLLLVQEEKLDDIL